MLTQELQILRDLPASLNPNFKIVGVVNKKGRNHLEAICVHCKTKKVYQKGNLARGKSCGCLTNQILREARTTHGFSKEHLNGVREYSSWRSMKQRCCNKNHKSFKEYGGRGIGICKRWDKFENFFIDMGFRPKGKTLGRINNNLGYKKSNCRWETYKQQARNRRNGHYLKAFGKEKTLAEWSEITGIGGDTLWKRVERGFSPEEVISLPLNARRKK